MRALIVDDDETVRLLCKRLLKKLGFIVEMAANGIEAVDLFTRLDFKLVLMDIQMPELDGYEATIEIRRYERANLRANAVIVAMTASQEKERAIACGMDDFLFKPFLFDTLKQVVDRWLQSSSKAEHS